MGQAVPVQANQMDLSSTETRVMEKTDGHWKIVHIHWSSR
jgi:hypothetical protein